MAKLHTSYQWLYKRYVMDKKTVEEIAEESKCTRQTVYNNLKKFGLL